MARLRQHTDLSLIRLTGVSESAWVWKTTFEVPKGEYKYLDLVFDGLDTICHVFVDDEKVLLTSNMFAGDV